MKARAVPLFGKPQPIPDQIAHNVFDHQDIFAALNGKLPLPEKFKLAHGLLKSRFGFIDRIAAAIYEPKTDLLKTFMHSSGGDSPLSFYSARLADSVSLQEILKLGRPRVINDMSVLNLAPAEHSRRLAAQKYGSSYTMPMLLNGEFFGFLFVNSYRKHAFDEEVLSCLDMAGHLLSSLVIHERLAMQNLLATVRTATGMAQHRDFETGTHLDRMSNYSRLVAREVAKKHQLSDDFVEHIFLFSPLHDIGKVGIPDSILLKPSGLTEAEFGIIKTHTMKGGKIIDMMLKNLRLDDLPHAGVLRNIALHHHEAIDGSGYNGLTGAEIPIEAKIVAVADVFDALTSVRPYKRAWSNDKAFWFLQSMAGSKFDSDCVAALINCRSEIEAIQAKFREEHL